MAERPLRRRLLGDGGAVKSRLFGDDAGVALFLGTVCLTWVGWHVGIFIADTYTIANTLANLAGGHLRIDHLEYGMTLGSLPGLHVVDGVLYGRNYGQAALALPLYYGLDLLSEITDLRLVLPGVWSLGVLAFARYAGRELGRESRALLVGSGIAVVLFAGNVVAATPFADENTALVALQLLSTLSVGVAAVSLYRLLDHFHGRRVGLTAGAGVVVATPLWFWAPIPKRHALVGAAVAYLLCAFAISRDHESSRTRVVLRSTGYAVVALVLWIHVFEGVLLLVAYGTADVTTAPTNRRRDVLTIGLVFALAVAPFVATNLAITGNPAKTPRLTPGYSAGDGAISLAPDGTVRRDAESEGKGSTGGNSTATEGSGGSGDSGGETGGTDGAGDTQHSPNLFEALGTSFRRGVSYVDRMAKTIDTAPRRLYHTYVRSGDVEMVGRANEYEPINLTLLESMPVVGALVGVLAAGVVTAGQRLRNERAIPSVTTAGARIRAAVRGGPTVLRTVRERVATAESERQTAAAAVGIFGLYGLLYFSFLPLHSQLTVRYLLPVAPALCYLVAGHSAVNTAIRTAPERVVGSYFGSVAVGVVGLAVVLPGLDLALGEAMQLHALVNLAAALLAAAFVVAVPFVDTENPPLGAGLGVAAGATTLLMVAMQFTYFEYGVYALPIAERVADALAVIP